MILSLLLQAGRKVSPRDAIQQQFNKQSWDPDTWTGVIIVGAAILILLVILHFILYYEKRGVEPQQTRDANKLSREIFNHLQLSLTQRELLKKMARELGLDSPVAMLISPTQFASYSEKWLSQSRSGRGTAELERIARTLFTVPTEA